jgi:DNA (cytosine-5)-methyltransferase 1
MLRAIREFHPRRVIGENVGGLVTWSEALVLEQIHLDLENEGYEVHAHYRLAQKEPTWFAD